MKSLTAFIKCLNPNLEISENRIFIKTNSENITFHALNQKVESAAKHLFENGIRTGDIVPILSDHSSDYIISLLALWIIGAVPAPLNSKLSSVELENQINFLKSKYLLQLNSNIKLGLQSITKLDYNIAKNLKNFDHKINIKPDQTAIILFTSGSSGKPKAVELTFSNLFQSAKIGNNYLKQTSKDRWLASLPFYHIGGFSILFRALMFGTELILPDDLKLDSIIQCINHFKPTLISLVSSQMNELLKNNIQPHSNLRHVLLGGGFIDSNLMSEALKKGWHVSKVYGSTEISSFVTVLSPDKFIKKPGSVGKAIHPNNIFIFDENGNELPNNVEGEIAIKGPTIMRRYFNDEAATKNKFVNSAYLTGDIGLKDEDGYLYVVNRRSDLIVTGGENVNSLEVEEAILKFPKVNEVCVFGIDDKKWGQKIAAAIVASSNAKFSLDDLKDFLVDKIASFKIPKEIYFVDELPKTELGKIKREQVKNLLT